MSLENLGQISGLIVAISGILGLFMRYVFIPFWKFTRKLKSNSREIWASLPVLFELSHRWPLLPEAGSLANCLKNIEERIVSHENLLRAFLRDYQHGYFRCDLEGRNTEVNRTYARWLEVGEDELLGHGWRGFLSGSSVRENYDKEWTDAFEDGREVEFEIEYRTSKFELKKFKVRAYPIHDVGGGPREYFGILTEKEKEVEY